MDADVGLNMANLFDALDHTPTLGDIQRHAERLARATDPETSKTAAEVFVASGKCAKDTELAWQLLKQFGPCSSKELETWSGYIDGKVRKRLAELRHIGRARIIGKRKCSVTGFEVQTWEAVG